MWLWLLIFLLIVIVVFTYIVFAPFYLEINSVDRLCRIRFHRLAAASLIIADGSLKIELSIAGWKKQIDLLAIANQPGKPRAAGNKKKASNISLRQIKAIFRSFKINKCYLSVDTGSVALNGILYPGFYLLSRHTGKVLEINFLNRNEIVLEIENNLAGILKAFIYSSLKTKKNGKLK